MFIKQVVDWLHEHRLVISWFLIGGLFQSVLYKLKAGDTSWSIDLLVLLIVFWCRRL